MPAAVQEFAHAHTARVRTVSPDATDCPAPSTSRVMLPPATASPIADVVRLLDQLWLCAAGSRDSTALNKDLYLRFHRALYRSLRTSWDLAECARVGDVDFEVDRKGNERGVTREWFRQSMISLASFWSGATEVNAELVAFLRHVANSLTIEDGGSRRLREWHEVTLGACIVPRKATAPAPAPAPPASAKRPAEGGPMALLVAELASGTHSLRRLAIANCVKRQVQAQAVGAAVSAPPSLQSTPRRSVPAPGARKPASFPQPSKRPASFDRLPPLRPVSPPSAAVHSKPPSPPPPADDPYERELAADEDAREHASPRRASVDADPSRSSRPRLLRRLGRLPASPAVPLPFASGHAPPLGAISPHVSASF